MTISRALSLSKWNRRALIFYRRVRRATQRIETVSFYILRGDKSLDFVMVSWMHNTATDINDINRKYIRWLLPLVWDRFDHNINHLIFRQCPMVSR
jgi:hypothetical protein